jgi:hypothetical protein
MAERSCRQVLTSCQKSRFSSRLTNITFCLVDITLVFIYWNSTKSDNSNVNNLSCNLKKASVIITGRVLLPEACSHSGSYRNSKLISVIGMVANRLFRIWRLHKPARLSTRLEQFMAGHYQKVRLWTPYFIRKNQWRKELMLGLQRSSARVIRGMDVTPTLELACV